MARAASLRPNEHWKAAPGEAVPLFSILRAEVRTWSAI